MNSRPLFTALLSCNNAGSGILFLKVLLLYGPLASDGVGLESVLANGIRRIRLQKCIVMTERRISYVQQCFRLL